jgi:hypothetical protein
VPDADYESEKRTPFEAGALTSPGALRLSSCHEGGIQVMSRILLASALFYCASAEAQTPSGCIQGKIKDKAALTAIESVEIVLEDADGHELLRSRSDPSGEFLFLGLPAGGYGLRILKEGYFEYRIRFLWVQDGSLSPVTLEMERSGAAPKETVVLSWQGSPSAPWASDPGSRFDRARLDSLPSARNVWALLQGQDISSVTDHIDEGGIHTGIPALVGLHGSTWTQNGYRWDGLNVTDPHDPGRPLTYPDYGGLQEFRVASADHAAVTSASGAEFQMATRRGRRQLHGQAEAYYLGDPFQSSNLDDRLRAFGYQTTPHFKRFPEGGFSLGGPLPKIPAWSFFTSLGIQSLAKIIPDFAVAPTTTVYSGLLRLDGALRRQDRLSLLVSGATVQHSNLGARAGINPSSTLRGTDPSGLAQGHWTHRSSDRSVYDLSFGFSRASPDDRFQAGITRPNYTRLFTGEMTGAAPFESQATRSRFSLLGQVQTIQKTSKNWQHQLAFGFDLEESFATEEQRVFQDLRLFTFPAGVPPMIAEFNVPSHARQRLRELSFFAEDRLQIAGRIFVRLGLNLDASSVSLPRQFSGAGPFVPEREFAGFDNVVAWTTMSPRFGLAVPLWRRNGTTKLLAGYSRYYHILPAAYADYANPNALGGRLYRWNDKNKDGVFQPGEEGTLLRVFGGPYSAVDPDLKRPYTDEYEMGLEHHLGHRLQIGLLLLQRDARRLVHTVNVGIPSTAYAPVKVADPGDDGVPGTGDDRILTVFNQDSATLGQDRYLLTNPANLNSTYKGMEATLTGGPFERGFFSVSFAAYKSEGDGNPGNSEAENDIGVVGSLFDDPNTRINARGRLFFDRAFVGKVAAYYRAPFGFHLGAVVSYFDGLPFGRKLIIPDFNQGPFYVMATPRGQPGGVRTQYVLTFDQRVSRDFDFGSVTVSIMIDIFNLLNLNKSLREFDISGPIFPQRRPTDIENPRAFRFGLRISF